MTPTLEDVFTYLDELRESGETNMFGAAPYVQREYGISMDDARALTSLWMATFNRESTAAERAEIAATIKGGRYE